MPFWFFFIFKKTCFHYLWLQKDKINKVQHAPKNNMFGQQQRPLLSWEKIVLWQEVPQVSINTTKSKITCRVDFSGRTYHRYYFWLKVAIANLYQLALACCRHLQWILSKTDSVRTIIKILQISLSQVLLYILKW